jgi:hypothetical protein
VLALKLLLEQAVKMRDGLQRVSKVGKVHAFEKKKEKKKEKSRCATAYSAGAQSARCLH